MGRWGWHCSRALLGQAEEWKVCSWKSRAWLPSVSLTLLMFLGEERSRT